MPAKRKQRIHRVPTWTDPETGDRLVPQEEAAKQLGVSTRALLRWETAGQAPNGTPFPRRTKTPDGRAFWWQSQINDFMRASLRVGVC